VTQVLRVADRAYVMRRGEVVLSGKAADVAARVNELEDSYIAAGVPAHGSEQPQEKE
jgi:branched-chain amino acid transport system ATP-binding protein